MATPNEISRRTKKIDTVEAMPSQPHRDRLAHRFLPSRSYPSTATKGTKQKTWSVRFSPFVHYPVRAIKDTHRNDLINWTNSKLCKLSVHWSQRSMAEDLVTEIHPTHTLSKDQRALQAAWDESAECSLNSIFTGHFFSHNIIVLLSYRYIFMPIDCRETIIRDTRRDGGALFCSSISFSVRIPNQNSDRIDDTISDAQSIDTPLEHTIGATHRWNRWPFELYKFLMH